MVAAVTSAAAPTGMLPRITNVRTWIEPPVGAPPGPDREPPARSAVAVESTVAPARISLGHPAPDRLTVDLHGLDLNMDPFRVRVLDGVIRWVTLSEMPGWGARCEIAADFPMSRLDVRVRQQAGIPHRTCILFSRQPLREVLGGRRIVIDPAHGGPDRGARGPINLEERHVVLSIAPYLAAELEEARARPLLVRDNDRAVPVRARLQAARDWMAEALVVLHTGHSTDPSVRGIRTGFHPGLPGSRDLARLIHAELLERLALPDRQVAPLAPPLPDLLQGCPMVAVEPVNLANPLDEALLRSTVFKARIAGAIRNGLARYFGQATAGSRGRASLAI